MFLLRAAVCSLLLSWSVIPAVGMSTPSLAATCPQAVIAVRAGSALIAAARAGSAPQFAAALSAYADMDAIALFGLGRHRRALPVARKREFTSAATHMISRTFNNYRLKFRADSIEFVDCRSDKVHTQMFFLGGRGYQPVIWRFRGNRIIDVNVQSIWLGQLLRTYIDEQMRKFGGDINAVIREMKR